MYLRVLCVQYDDTVNDSFFTHDVPLREPMIGSANADYQIHNGQPGVQDEPVEAAVEAHKTPSKHPRLLSLDAFRFVFHFSPWR